MICSKCGEPRENNKGKCANCNRLYQRKWYSQNKKVQHERVQKNSEKYRKRNQEWVYEYLLKSPCVDCGLIDPLVMDFDHIDRSTKTKGVSVLIRNGAPLEKLIEEIEKCLVRCSNCHRRRTAQQLGWWKYFEGKGR